MIPLNNTGRLAALQFKRLKMPLLQRAKQTNCTLLLIDLANYWGINMLLSEQIGWLSKELKAAEDCKKLSERYDGDPDCFWTKRIEQIKAVLKTLNEVLQNKAYE